MKEGEIRSVLAVAYSQIAEDADLDMSLRTRFVLRWTADYFRTQAIAAGEVVD